MRTRARMVSYAQNAEDVVLHRTFPRNHGYYVDVGAAWPVKHSVTNHFYQSGWRGINVEPSEPLFRLLLSERPDDRNVCSIVGDANQSLLHYFPEAEGLSTTLPEVARGHSNAGHRVEVLKRPVTSLDDIIDRMGRPERIDFLKIDVEGAEASVLAGFDLVHWSPRVLVVEATDPVTGTFIADEWSDRVQSAGYVRTLFDGLNCFYVASDQLHLLDVLSVPANVYDHYIPYKWLKRIPSDGHEEALK